MSGHRDFNELLTKMSPERRARVKAEANNLHREYVLSLLSGDSSNDILSDYPSLSSHAYSPMPNHDEEIRADKPASRLKGIVPIPQKPVSLNDMEDAIQNVERLHGIT